MNDSFPIFLVDVFAQHRYAGNPLAVVVCAQPLAHARMQKISAEMNFSETAFVAALATGGGGYSTRIFASVGRWSPPLAGELLHAVSDA